MEQALVTYEQEMAALAEQYAREAAGSGRFITTAGGIFQVGGEELPGNMIAAVIVDVVRENTYYEGAWNPDNITPPVCYAFGRVETDMAPHASMQVDLDYFKPQSAKCKGCPKNEYGSAERGQGKACANRRRLALLPAGYYVAKPKSKDFDLHLYEDPDHYKTAELMFLKVPPTSTKGFDKFVRTLAERRVAPFGVVTSIAIERHPKWQHEILFTPVNALPPEVGAIVMQRRQEAAAALVQGYSPPEDGKEIPF
jgi:hypothetical protein